MARRFSNHPQNFSSLKELNAFSEPSALDQTLFDDISLFYKERKKLDQIIHHFCHELTEQDLMSNLDYTNTNKEKHCKRLGSLELHVFLHQIHHRGQVTTLLSQESIDFGETDLPEIIPNA